MPVLNYWAWTKTTPQVKVSSSEKTHLNRVKISLYNTCSNDNPLHKKWSFPLRISSVNVTKYAVFVQWSMEAQLSELYLSKVIKIGYFVKYFSSDIVQFSSTFAKIFVSGGLLRTCLYETFNSTFFAKCFWMAAFECKLQFALHMFWKIVFLKDS